MADLEIDDQRDFFREVRLDANGALIVALEVTKEGATQAAAGAVAGELWSTVGHASLPDGVVMKGI